MTADFGNFVAKTDEKQKTKDEMKQTMNTQKKNWMGELAIHALKFFNNEMLNIDENDQICYHKINDIKCEIVRI